MSVIELEQVNHFCLRKQHLTDDSNIDDVVQIARDIAGLHATYPTTPYLSLFVRNNHFKKEDLDGELFAKRTLGKMRSARKTVYVLPKEMLPVAFNSIKSMLEDRFEGFIKYQGFTMEEYQEISKFILAILRNKGMTTNEIKKALGIKANISFIVNVMCDRGLLIRGEPKGGWKSNAHIYYKFQAYFPDVDLSQVDETTAKTLLVKQYIASFGPVTEHDISWWTGFKKGEVKEIAKSLQDQIKLMEISNLKENYIMLTSDEKALQSIEAPHKSIVNLLPLLDPYLMGYKDRARYLSQEHYGYIYDRSGNATSTILVNGRIAGIWDFYEAKEPMVKLYFFEEVEGNVLKEIYSRAHEIGTFIADKAVTIKECASMVPLTQRTFGGFMSPLKDC